MTTNESAQMTMPKKLTIAAILALTLAIFAATLNIKPGKTA